MLCKISIASIIIPTKLNSLPKTVFKMSRYTSFDHFVRDLFLCPTSYKFKVSDKELKKIPLVGHTEGALNLFQSGHGFLFQKIFKHYEYRDFQSDEQFFRFAIPRCLKLIDNERYFYSMLLIATFLLEFLLFMKNCRYCYRFCFTAYKCFLAVFKRALEDDFEVHGGLEGLGKFSNEVQDSADSLEKKKIRSPEERRLYLLNAFNNYDPDLVVRAIKLIEKCDEISDESFQLNDYELSLLTDNDIDEILQSLKNETIDEDPLDLQWPPGREKIREKLMSSWEDFSHNNPVGTDEENEDLDQYKVEDYIMNSEPDLPEYISTLEIEAKERLGCEVFKEKMELRKCPCCGTKCFKFSRELYLKQLDSALVDNSEKGSRILGGFI